MIELAIYNQKGERVDMLAIDEKLLGDHVRPALLKQAYVMFHANQRQGSARTKGRSDVEGSTRKLYRQKGTGNARVGNARTNIRKGGGVAFAKTKVKEAYRLDMPKKMRRLANRNALLSKLIDNEVKCVDSLSFAQPKTAAFQSLLKSLGVDRTCLVALDGGNRNALLSVRNVDGVQVTRVEQLNAFDLLNHRYLLVDKASLQAFLDGSVWSRPSGDDGKEAA